MKPKLKLTPVGVDDEQELLAKHIATELVRHDFDSVMALPVAIGIMGVIQDAIDNNIQAAIKGLRKSWDESDKWWLKYHPKTETAKKIKNGTMPGSKKWLATMGEAVGLNKGRTKRNYKKG